MISLVINGTYIILSLMYNQFIFRLLVGRKCNLFVTSFIEYIHWKSKFWQCSAHILAALLKVSRITFKIITIFIISTTKLRITLALPLPGTSEHASSREKRDKLCTCLKDWWVGEPSLKPCPTVQEASAIMPPPSAKSGCQYIWM